jgi:DNA-binding HxlR family transcriptional regulator
VARSSTARAPENTAVKAHATRAAKANLDPHPAVEISLPDLDRVIHEKMRLGIVSALAVSESLTFNELKRLLQTTDGNLSVHARRLEEAKYVECTKSFEGRMPKTEYKLTEQGRRAFERYLNHMEALIHAMRER